MLAKCLILIVEDDPYVALDLSTTIEDCDGRVVGPTRDVGEALAFLNREPVGAAIIDWHLSLQTAAPVADWLIGRQVPFVIHTTQPLALADRERHSAIPILIKPLQPRTVIARLIAETRRVRRDAGKLSEYDTKRN